MKVSQLNTEAKNIIKPKTLLKENKYKLRNVLTTIFSIVEKFEQSGEGESKNTKEKIEVLKNVISDMVKDEDQKNIIRGNG